jgi:subtilisin family serine protease
MIIIFLVAFACSIDNKKTEDITDLSNSKQNNVVIEIITTTTITTTKIEDIPFGISDTLVSDGQLSNTVPLIIQQPQKEVKCYVVSKESDNPSLSDILRKNNISPTQSYKENLNGASFCTENMQIISNLLKENVSVEEDIAFKISSVQSPISRHLFLMSNYTNSFFNSYFYDNFLFRILQIERLFRYYQGTYKYYYTGKNTKVFMIDTTVNVSAPNINNLSGRKRSCNSHGDVNVGLLIDSRKGFARDTEILILDGVDCDGNIKLSNILSHLELVKKDTRGTILLFGVSGQYSEILNNVVNKIGNSGIIVIAPSGNDHDNACYHSPSSAKKVLSVGSVNKYTHISNFSNYGSCVRIYSLGEDIYEHSRTRGTSHSATVIAGAVSMYLEKYSNASFSDIWTYLNNNSYWNGYYLVFKIPYLSQEYKAATSEFRDSESIGENIVSFILMFIIIFVIVYIVYYFFCKIKKKKRNHDYVVDPNERTDRK